MIYLQAWKPKRQRMFNVAGEWRSLYLISEFAISSIWARNNFQSLLSDGFFGSFYIGSFRKRSKLSEHNRFKWLLTEELHGTFTCSKDRCILFLVKAINLKFDVGQRLMNDHWLLV